MKISNNHRGKTSSGRYTWKPIIQLEPHDYPPMSNYWRLWYMYEVERLLNIMPYEKWECWFDETFPEDVTFKELANAHKQKYMEMVDEQ